ncbi:MAG: GldG family protein [Verrucomicrobiota bacterium]
MNTQRFNEFRIARRFRAVNRTIQIVLSISLIIALNYLAANYFRRIDLTDTGTYTLAPESKAYIRQLTEPVDIIVTIPEDPDVPELEEIHNDLRKILREYEAKGRENGKNMINVEFVDIFRQRKRAQEIANKYQLTQENVILVASGERTREIRQAELYEVADGEIKGFRGEKAFTSAIIDVSSDKTEKIYFMVGHGEMRLGDVDPLRGLSQLESFLRERNFTLATIDLSLVDAVPDDADLIIAPSPQAALLPIEVEKLRRYMSDRNGRMIALVDPGRRHGMEELFYDWGVLVEDMVVVDPGPDFRAQGGDLIIRRFAEHPITEMLINFQITALFGPPRPVRVDPASVGDERLQVTQIIGSSTESWAERDFRQQDPFKYDPGRDLKGPISIATLSTRSAGSELGITIPGGRFAVFGNSDFVANNRFLSFGNRTLLINTINWTLDRTSLLNIPTRPLERYQIVMSDQELNKLLLYLSFLPIAAALFGFFIFFLRRR